MILLASTADRPGSLAGSGSGPDSGSRPDSSGSDSKSLIQFVAITPRLTRQFDRNVADGVNRAECTTRRIYARV